MNRAAQQLGRLAKGVPKTLSPAFLAANREKLDKINAALERTMGAQDVAGAVGFAAAAASSRTRRASTFTTRSSDSGEPIDRAEQYVFEHLSGYGLEIGRAHV